MGKLASKLRAELFIEQTGQIQQNKRVRKIAIACIPFGIIAIPTIWIMGFLIGAGTRSYPILFAVVITSFFSIVGLVSAALYHKQPTRFRAALMILGSLYSGAFVLYVAAWLMGAFA